MPLEDFNADEIERVLILTRQFKNRFGGVAKEMLDRGRIDGIDDHIMRMAIVSECLFLAAAMYGSDREHFLEASRAAHDFIARTTPRPGSLQ
jgi:hypothetical protein